MDQITYARTALKEKYQYVRDRNPYFSFRAYSRKLGIAVSTFSNFVASKSDIGPELLARIMQKVLTEDEYTSFQTLIYKEPAILQFTSVLELNRLDASVRFRGLYKKALQDQYYVFAAESTFEVITKRINDLIIEISDILGKQDPLEEKMLCQLTISGLGEVRAESAMKVTPPGQHGPGPERDQRLCRNL